MNLQTLQTVQYWGMLATLKMSFSFVNILKQLLHMTHLTRFVSWEKVVVLVQMVLQLWTPAFGTESHQSHLNPLCDSLANISNEDRATRVTRTVESMNSASVIKASPVSGWRFSQLCYGLCAQTKPCYSHWREMVVEGKSFKMGFWTLWWTQNVFNQKARLQFEAIFSDKSELQKRIYLVDIFAILNELNLYGKDQTHHASICPKRSDQSKSDLSFG